jgi:predicted nuclease with TOPRIM domain
MKLTQENEKLEAELKAMSERLEAMERRRAQLAKGQEKPSS